MFTCFISEPTQKLLKGNKAHRNKAKRRGHLRLNILEARKQMNLWSLPWLIRDSWTLSNSKDSSEVANSYRINPWKVQKGTFQSKGAWGQK